MENKHLDNNQTLSEALWNACLLHHFKYGVPHSLSLSPQLRVTESLHASGRASAGTVWQLSHRGYESWPACGARCPPRTLLLFLQPFPISIRSHRARARNSLYVACLKEGICYVSPLDPHAVIFPSNLHISSSHYIVCWCCRACMCFELSATVRW